MRSFDRNSIVCVHCKNLKIHKLFFIITLLIYYILTYTVGPTAWLNVSIFFDSNINKNYNYYYDNSVTVIEIMDKWIIYSTDMKTLNIRPFIIVDVKHSIILKYYVIG